MEDLLKIQIHDNCRIALPEGLKDLMSDISREVLRAQPKDLLGFITDYLSTLLVTRENLCIASRLCDDVCKYLCAAGLEDELKFLGLSEDNVGIVARIVNKHLDAADVGNTFEEANLLQKLLLRTSIPVEMMSKIQEAVRKTFLRHQSHQSAILDSSPDEDLDDVSRAVRHTLELYRKTNPTEDEYNRAAVRIEVAYRAYSIKRERAKAESNQWSYADDVIARTPMSSEDLNFDEMYKEIKKTTEETPRLEGEPAILTDSERISDQTEVYIHRERISSISSASLAGSFLTLPKLKPYSIHDMDDALTVTEEDHTEDQIEEQIDERFDEELEQKSHILDDTDKVGEVKECNDLRKLFVRDVIHENDEDSEIDEEIEEPDTTHFDLQESVVCINPEY